MIRIYIRPLAVMLGIFSIVTVEILPIGLLTPIAEEFDISEGTAGLTMTLPGLLAAVSAPLVILAVGKIDRRTVLYSMMFLLAVADFLAAVAPSYWVMLLSRVIVGITIGGFWSLSAGLAQQLVEERHVTAATSLIFSAVPLGSVLGVPLGTLVGNVWGWRSAFAVVGVFTLAVFVLLIAVIPSLPPDHAITGRMLRKGLVAPGSIAGVVITAFVVLAHFGAYTYIEPFLGQIGEFSHGGITTLLLIYGAAGVIGNFAIGKLMANHHRFGFGIGAALIGVSVAGLALAGGQQVFIVLALVVWGFAYGGVPVASNTWIAKNPRIAPEVASVLFTAPFQATISIGALVGGVIVDSSGVVTVMWASAGTAGVATIVIAAVSLLAARGQTVKGKDIDRVTSVSSTEVPAERSAR